MRETKFRAWDSEADCFTYSDKPDDNYIWGFEDGKLKAWAISEYGGSIHEPPQPVSIELEMPKQYTGRKDKNTIDIYDGDILVGMANDSVWAEKQFIGAVEWKYSQWYLGWGNFRYKAPFDFDSDTEYLEIVGNIRQNPEAVAENE